MSLLHDDYLPTDADIAFYEERGWFISRLVFDEDVIDDLLYATERHYAGERDYELLYELHNDWTPATGDVMRQNDYVSLQNETIRRFTIDSPIGAVARALARTPKVRLFHDQLIYKPADGRVKKSTVAWHTDYAYWDTCTSDKMLTAWVALDDIRPDMGPMVMIDRSHRWSSQYAMRNFHDQDNAASIAAKLAEGHNTVEVPMLLRRGQVSFHHCRTIHGGYPNKSAAPRRGYAIHMQDASNCYRRHLLPDKQLAIHTNDVLCRKDAAGSPDYGDPFVCPEMHPVDERMADAMPLQAVDLNTERS